MILCLDVGNSHVYGGVFENNKLVLSFRHGTKEICSSDQFGIFLKAVLRENNVNSSQIKQIGLCSVVPNLDYSIRSACIKYFSLQPFHLQAGVKTGLKIKYKNPLEVGADRIANAIAATTQFPIRNLLVIDFGTATTFDAISKDKAYLGGVIMPGLNIAMQALQQNTAKLSTVEIIKPSSIIGKSTISSIQSGLYFGQLAILEKFCHQIRDEAFAGEEIFIIGTGGFAVLFAEENIFDCVIPDLVLQGIRIAMDLNVDVPH